MERYTQLSQRFGNLDRPARFPDPPNEIERKTAMKINYFVNKGFDANAS